MLDGDTVVFFDVMALDADSSEPNWLRNAFET
jgi:hypothetical protein